MYVEVMLEQLRIHVLLDNEKTSIENKKLLNAVLNGDVGGVEEALGEPGDQEFADFMKIHEDQWNQDHKK